MFPATADNFLKSRIFRVPAKNGSGGLNIAFNPGRVSISCTGDIVCDMWHPQSDGFICDAFDDFVYGMTLTGTDIQNVMFGLITSQELVDSTTQCIDYISYMDVFSNTGSIGGGVCVSKNREYLVVKGMLNDLWN